MPERHRYAAPPVDPWALLTGGSVGLVAGFAADLLRMGLHAARRPRAPTPVGAGLRAAPAVRSWRCPRGCG